ISILLSCTHPAPTYIYPLSLHDALPISRIPQFGDDVAITNAAYINQNVSADEQVFEISGDVAGSVPAILRVVNSDTLNLLEDLRSEEHTSELQSRENLVCRLLLEKKKHT